MDLNKEFLRDLAAYLSEYEPSDDERFEALVDDRDELEERIDEWETELEDAKEELEETEAEIERLAADWN